MASFFSWARDGDLTIPNARTKPNPATKVYGVGSVRSIKCQDDHSAVQTSEHFQKKDGIIARSEIILPPQ
jgi:hypothetical protein